MFQVLICINIKSSTRPKRFFSTQALQKNTFACCSLDNTSWNHFKNLPLEVRFPISWYNYVFWFLDLNWKRIISLYYVLNYCRLIIWFGLRTTQFHSPTRILELTRILHKKLMRCTKKSVAPNKYFRVCQNDPVSLQCKAHLQNSWCRQTIFCCQ